jgi:hypothetical protein
MKLATLLLLLTLAAAHGADIKSSAAGRFRLFSATVAGMSDQPQLLKVDTRTGRTWLLVFSPDATNRDRKVGFYELSDFDTKGRPAIATNAALITSQHPVQTASIARPSPAVPISRP